MDDQTPRFGFEVELENQNGGRQRYRCVGTQRTGYRTIAFWEVTCAVCSSVFQVTSPATARAVRHRQDGLFATKCQLHRRSKLAGDR